MSGARVRVGSKRETAMVRAYFTGLPEPRGTLLLEYRAVRAKLPGNTGRWIDGVIVRDGNHGREAAPSDYGDLRGKSVVVIQAKASRLGMSLMGQALYSMHLMERKEIGAKVVESIALCSKTDSVLEALTKGEKRLRIVTVDSAPVEEPSEA